MSTRPILEAGSPRCPESGDDRGQLFQLCGDRVGAVGNGRGDPGQTGVAGNLVDAAEIGHVQIPSRVRESISVGDLGLTPSPVVSMKSLTFTQEDDRVLVPKVSNHGRCAARGTGTE